MELYIVRHGKTMWNEQGRLQGHVDIPLNEEGREAAIRLQSRLSDICFDAIYSSPLKRAHETAELICGSRKIPIITDDRLLEISFGDMEGIHCDDWFDEKSPYRFFFTDPSRYQTPPAISKKTLLSKSQRIPTTTPLPAAYICLSLATISIPL